MEHKHGRLKPDEAQELLETMVFQQLAGDCAQKGGSRLAKVRRASWQADILRQSKEVLIVESAEKLREAMGSSSTPVIFLPQTAMVTLPIIERICTESALDKFVIWETE